MPASNYTYSIISYINRDINIFVICREIRRSMAPVNCTISSLGSPILPKDIEIVVITARKFLLTLIFGNNNW